MTVELTYVLPHQLSYIHKLFSELNNHLFCDLLESIHEINRLGFKLRLWKMTLHLLPMESGLTKPYWSDVQWL